jgi:nitrate reductase gamma subunit
VLFHGLALIGAIFIKTIGLDISASSGNIGGLILYYGTIIVALTSFTLGTIGSIGLLIKRTVDKELNEYTSAQNYFNYIFFLAVFVSGLIAYITSDPTYSHYREYWVGLISLQGTHIAAAEYVHIILFSLFLIYLPFTRSTHYITKIMAFFGIRWDDAMNVEGSKMEEKIAAALNLPVSWSAPHIKTGKSWGENAMGLPEETGTVEGK